MAFPFGAIAAKGSWSILTKLKYFFLFLIFGIMLVQAINIGYQTDIAEGFKFLGLKFALASESLGEESRLVIAQEGVWDSNAGFFVALWSFITLFWRLFEAIFVIYIWIKLLAWFSLHFILWDSSKTAVSFALGALIYTFVNIIFLLAFADQPIGSLFENFKDFFRALPFIFSPLVSLADMFSKESNITSIIGNASNL